MRVRASWELDAEAGPWEAHVWDSIPSSSLWFQSMALVSLSLLCQSNALLPSAATARGNSPTWQRAEAVGSGSWEVQGVKSVLG